MIRSLVVLPAAIVAIGGCVQTVVPDACKAFPAETCLSVEIRPPSNHGVHVDQVDFASVELGFAQATASPTPAGNEFALPVVVALLPDQNFEGDFALAIRGLLSGTVVGSTSTTGHVVRGQHLRLSATLGVDSLVDGDMAGFDGLTQDACVPMSTCPSTLSCGTISDGCGGTIECGPCLLTSISPKIASTGMDVFLEGTFADTVVATFPGGVTATGTVLGPHRAKVSVPAGATTGDLTVTTGNQKLGPFLFHHTRQNLVLGPFAGRYEQPDIARQFPSLTTPTGSFALIRVGRYVYSIGGYPGYTTTISRALINADGTLGSFVSTGNNLSVGRAYHTATVVGQYVYVLGGNVLGGTATSSVERAAINSDDSLGTFAPVAGLALQSARAMHSAAILGDGLYVFGGVGSQTIERATITADGSISAFSTLTSTLSAQRYLASAVVVGTHLYLVGGTVVGGTPSSIDHAAINPDGSLGAFAALSTTLTTARTGPAVAAIGQGLYVIGGRSSAEVASIESAAIDLDGKITSTFSVLPLAMTTARAFHSAIIVGNHLYVFGGVANNNNLATGERAAVVASPTLAGPLKIAPTLSSARAYHSNVVLGNYVYAIGGQNGGGLIGGIDRATLASDGSPGAFSSLSGITLVSNKSGGGYVVAGSYLYAVGGQDSATTFATGIQRANINADGSIGSFTNVAQALIAGRSSVRLDMPPSELKAQKVELFKPTAFDGLHQGWGNDPWWRSSNDPNWGLTKNGTKEAVMPSQVLGKFKQRTLMMPSEAKPAADTAKSKQTKAT